MVDQELGPGHAGKFKGLNAVKALGPQETPIRVLLLLRGWGGVLISWRCPYLSAHEVGRALKGQVAPTSPLDYLLFPSSQSHMTACRGLCLPPAILHAVGVSSGHLCEGQRTCCDIGSGMEH